MGFEKFAWPPNPWPLPVNDQTPITILPSAVPIALVLPIHGPGFGLVATRGPIRRPIRRPILGPTAAPIFAVSDLAPVITCA